jgi:hypothetical protein
MRSPLRGALIVLAAILGVIAGAVLAFYATYYACVLLDAVQVGWIFCFITVPAGAGIGGVMGAGVTAWIVKRDA